MTAAEETTGGAQMLTALVRLRGALQAAALPLEGPGVDEQRGVRAEMVDQLEDYVIPRVMSVEAPLLVVVGGSTGALVAPHSTRRRTWSTVRPRAGSVSSAGTCRLGRSGFDGLRRRPRVRLFD